MLPMQSLWEMSRAARQMSPLPREAPRTLCKGLSSLRCGPATTTRRSCIIEQELFELKQWVGYLLRKSSS